MVTASATTNELGHVYNTIHTVGYSGHGGTTKSIYLDFKKRPYIGDYPITYLREISRLNPVALKELLKTGVKESTKVTHETAYTTREDKDGKTIESNLGQYLSFTVNKKKIATLIKGHSCLFFVDGKKVTDLNATVSNFNKE
jgi:hypothetical protein